MSLWNRHETAGTPPFASPRSISLVRKGRAIESIVAPIRWAMAGPIGVSLLALAGCAGQNEALPTLTPLPTPAPTSTPSVGFAVVLTQVPTARPTGTPAPTATAFAVPAGPYVQLIPSTGPPISRRIVVRGGHLPPSVAI